MQDEFLRLQSMLQKTIVFITHDFDEAIRLADRIAIMYEGLIVQLGTAEELVTNPATDYVANFTKDVPRDKLLTVRSVMTPGVTDGLGEVTVSADDKIATVARRVLSDDRPARVVDAEGATVGAVVRQRLIDTLFEGNA